MSAASAKTQDPSMEDILASIRRIISDDGEGGQGHVHPAPAAPPPAPAEDDEVLDLAELPAHERPPADLDIDVPDLSFQSAPEPAEPQPAPRPMPVLEPPPAHNSNAAAVPPAAAEPAIPRLDTLVSNETTAAVGHAFNLLSHTILTQNARTLEDLVGEMLKPMLKAWLDDNLPPIVERLVRHEIERVARGNR